MRESTNILFVVTSHVAWDTREIEFKLEILYNKKPSFLDVTIINCSKARTDTGCEMFNEIVISG